MSIGAAVSNEWLPPPPVLPVLVATLVELCCDAVVAVVLPPAPPGPVVTMPPPAQPPAAAAPAIPTPKSPRKSALRMIVPPRSVLQEVAPHDIARRTRAASPAEGGLGYGAARGPIATRS